MIRKLQILLFMLAVAVAVNADEQREIKLDENHSK